MIKLQPSHVKLPPDTVHDLGRSSLPLATLVTHTAAARDWGNLPILAPREFVPVSGLVLFLRPISEPYLSLQLKGY